MFGSCRYQFITIPGETTTAIQPLDISVKSTYLINPFMHTQTHTKRRLTILMKYFGNKQSWENEERNLYENNTNTTKSNILKSILILELSSQIVTKIFGGTLRN